MLAAIAFQALHGYFRFEIGAYLAWFVWPVTVDAVLLAVLAVFVQVLVPHKYIGWGVMLVYIVVTGVLSAPTASSTTCIPMPARRRCRCRT